MKKVITFFSIALVLSISLLVLPQRISAAPTEQQCNDGGGTLVNGACSCPSGQEWHETAGVGRCYNSASLKALGGVADEKSGVSSDRAVQGYTEEDQGGMFERAGRKLIGYIVSLILRFVSLITGVGSVLLNASIYYTIVKMAENYAKIAVVDNAWSIVRDVANMGFIFVLLYAAITTIIGQGSDNKKLIVNLVVAAILVNFSLFFTKLVIDASNILTLTFYKAIVPDPSSTLGLGDSLMQALNLQSLYDAGQSQTIPITVPGIIMVGMMGSIMLLIAAFIFFAIAIMFVIRYVVLIFLLILSPIYFVGKVLPGVGEYTKKWSEALKGQAFFAPIYMLLTYISINVIQGVMQPGVLRGDGNLAAAGQVLLDPSTNTQGLAEVFINYSVIIAFLVFSLIVAKDWANKAPGVGKLTGWATGKAGGATFGVAGTLGRNIIGSRAADMANDDELRRKAAEGNVRARLQLAAANKLSKSSFDFRATGVAGTMGAGKAQKGGFAEDQKQRAKKYEQYKPTDDAKKSAAARVEAAKGTLDKAKEEAAKKAEDQIPKDDINKAEEELKQAQDLASRPPLEGLSQEDIATSKARNAETVKKAEEKVKAAQTARKAAIDNYVKTATTSQQKAYEEARGIEMEMATRMENMASRAEDNVVRGKIPFTNKRYGFTMPPFVPTSVMVSGKNKAKAIRAAAKGKSNKEKLAEAAAAVAKDEKDAEGGEEKKEEKKEEGKKEEK